VVGEVGEYSISRVAYKFVEVVFKCRKYLFFTIFLHKHDKTIFFTGSSRSNFSILKVAQQLSGYLRDLESKSQERQEIEQQLAKFTQTLREKQDLDRRTTEKRRQIEEIRAKLETNDQHRVVADIKRFEAEIGMEFYSLIM